MPYSFPIEDNTLCTAVVCIDGVMLPIIAGTLSVLEERRVWATDEDHHQGYNAIARMYIDMATNCFQELVEGQDRLYRLLDTALYGRVYEATSIEPLVVSPIIPVVPDLTADFPGLLARSAFIAKALNNLSNGTVYTEFPDNRGVKQQLADILAAVQAGQETDPEVMQLLQSIALALA